MIPFNELKSFLLKDIESSDTEIDKGPGIYAWYSEKIIAPIDLKEGKDEEGLDEILSILDNFISQHTPDSVSVDIRSTFNERWSGPIENVSGFKLSDKVRDNETGFLDEFLEGSSEDGETKSGPVDVLKNFSGRKLLSQSFESAIPIFSSPLYIGVSKNLRRRLLEHSKDFYDADKDVRERVLSASSAKSFAERAAVKGFGSDSLRVFIFPLKELSQADGMTNEQLRTVGGLLEWILNRCHQPLLGKI